MSRTSGRRCQRMDLTSTFFSPNRQRSYQRRFACPCGLRNQSFSAHRNFWQSLFEKTILCQSKCSVCKHRINGVVRQRLMGDTSYRFAQCSLPASGLAHRTEKAMPRTRSSPPDQTIEMYSSHHRNRARRQIDPLETKYSKSESHSGKSLLATTQAVGALKVGRPTM